MESNLLTSLSLAGCIIVLLIGIPGNILIIRSYFAIKRIQTVQNMFILSLAITDIILIGYVLPFHMFHVLHGYSTISRDVCILNAFVAQVCFTCSIQTIMQISVNRCVKICRPVLQYCRIYTRRNSILLALSCWIVGVVSFIPSVIDIDEHIIYDSTMTMCTYNRYGDRSYTLIFHILFLNIPFYVTIFCYVKIQRYVWKGRRQISRHWNNGLSLQRFVQDLRSTKSHAIIFISYLVLYFPMAVTMYFINSPNDVPLYVHQMSVYLCFVNSCINCLIYGVLNGNRRRAFKESLQCRIHCKKLDSQSRTSRTRVFPGESVDFRTAVHIYSISTTLPHRHELSM